MQCYGSSTLPLTKYSLWMSNNEFDKIKTRARQLLTARPFIIYTITDYCKIVTPDGFSTLLRESFNRVVSTAAIRNVFTT